MSGLALTDRRFRRAIALLMLVTVIGGCGGADEPDDREPAKIRIDGGKVRSGRLQESPAQREATIANQSAPASTKSP